MKRITKYFGMFALAMLLFARPQVAYATSDANAVADILNNQRYEGAIESIQSVTEIVDTGFTMFITFIAFFIISAAMLRNVLAGAYCAFPKFWDKVDAAHKEVQDTGWVQRIKGLTTSYQNINAGSFAKALLRLLPNIKMLTDFEEESIEPKSYFIKAIPQMIFVVIIGVFIYNGYYRDTAAVVSNFGSELFNRVILSADPISIYDRIAGASGRPEFASDSDKSDKGQLVNKISEKCYSKVISTYSDVKGAANKSSLAQQLEAWVNSNIDGCDTYATNHDNWAYSFDVTMTVGATNQATGIKKSTDGLKAAYVFNSLPISQLNLDTTKEQGVDWNLNVVVNFKKRAAASKTKTVNDLVFSWHSSKTTANNKVTLKLPTTTDGKLVVAKTAGSSKIGGKPVTCNSDYTVFTFPEGLPSGKEWSCSGVYYKDSTGKQHMVKTIKWTNSNGTSKVSSAEYGITVNYGQPVNTQGKTKEDNSNK